MSTTDRILELVQIEYPAANHVAMLSGDTYDFYPSGVTVRPGLDAKRSIRVGFRPADLDSEGAPMVFGRYRTSEEAAELLGLVDARLSGQGK